MKKLLSVILVLGIVFAACTGCVAQQTSQASSSTSSEPSQSASTTEAIPSSTAVIEQEGTAPKYVGIIFPSLANEFLAGMANEIKSALEAKGIKVDLVTPDDDQAKQLNQIENFANMGIDTLLLFPIGKSDIASTLQSLRDSGIRVILIANSVGEGCFDAMLSVDYAAIGADTAKSAAQWIDETFPDAEPGSIPVALMKTTSSTESKTQSDALERVTEFTDKAVIVERFDLQQSDPASKVQEDTDILFSSYPDVKCILAYNSSQATAADEVVMRTNGIDYSKFGIFTSDMTNAIGQRILDSVDGKSVIRATNMIGDGTQNIVIETVLGNVTPDANGYIFYPVTIINAENAAQFIW